LAARRHPACKKYGQDGGRHWLGRTQWRPAEWSVCLPLLIFPCTIKSRSSLLAPAHPRGRGKKAANGCSGGGEEIIIIKHHDKAVME